MRTWVRPPITWCLAVVFVDLAIAFAPCVILAGSEFRPLEQVFVVQAGSLRPVLHLVDNLVTSVVRDPNSF